MKLLSIDVGIKNLAYCLFEFNAETHEYHILLWDVINLCGNIPNCSSPSCKKVSKFTINVAANVVYLCPTHAKKSNYIIPTANFSLKKIAKMKLTDLHKVIQDYTIPLSAPSAKKEEILKRVMQFMVTKMLQPVTTIIANDFDLIKLGIAMRDAFQRELVNHIETLDKIVIENQISPIANRMKTLQGMIAQFFIMHDKPNISFVSAANKLKGISCSGDEIKIDDGENDNTNVETGLKNYALRKKEGIKITQALIKEKYIQWLPHFNQHKKKDDLADAFLQGIYVLRKPV